MTVAPLGDRAFLLRDLSVEPFRLAAALNANPPKGLHEAVAAYDSVGLYVDPSRFQPESVLAVTVSLAAAVSSAGVEALRRHEIPVWYEAGLDFQAAAHQLGISKDELRDHHSAPVYRCVAVGFRPGFAYLASLPSIIAGLPRMPQPRLRVPQGSVGITGAQTGVYPQEGPGGWWLIGLTPLVLVDPGSGYYPIQAGDEVKFVPIDEAEFRRREGVRL